MFERIKSYFNKLWQSISSFINNMFTSKTYFTNQDKYNFVMYLLNGQKEMTGFALRHVDSDEIKNKNIKHGFLGDAISFSITPFIMSAVLNEPIDTCSWLSLESGQISLMTNYMSRPILIDQALAVRIFDCLHEKTLQFIGLNFLGDIHHFMLVNNMNKAPQPYDIKEIYPTGKCGKQEVKASQIVKVFSKNERVRDKDQMLQQIEAGILQLARPTKHTYSKESTAAILTILREINLSSNDSKLEMENVRKRLVESEVQTSWSDYKYHAIYDHGILTGFTQSISDVNDDLEYFRALV